jgi:hypothetical protein
MQEIDQCYICMNPSNLCSVCKCSMKVHTEWLKQWVLESGSNKCSICLSEYTNVKIKDSYCLLPTWKCISIIITIPIGSLMMIFGVSISHWAISNMNNVYMTSIIMIMICFACFMIFLGSSLFAICTWLLCKDNQPIIYRHVFRKYITFRNQNLE